MTQPETDNLRHEVWAGVQALTASKVDILHKCRLQTLMASGQIPVYPPFAVMGSTEMDPSDDLVSPIRRYPW
jgi:hypothetical protein